ncbi:cytochrome P450 [Streptomyces sp. NBC_01167]|uniref:cytochrome P450 n=1 Tax=Streptomyces sp. NBC_01167 TaxID=2903756 RepID=UPI003870B6B0|nr:cytochrome P450 [Streptomyces sp. NBC_01167]
MAPGALPGLGHMLQLGRHPLDFLESLRHHGPVVRVRIGGWTMYTVTDPELVRRILMEEAGQFGRGRIFERLRPLFGNGLVISDGAFHRSQRHIMQPAFHHDRITVYTQIMLNHAMAMVDSWHDGQTVWVDQEMRQHALSVVAETMFSSAVAGDAIAEVHRSLPVILEGMFLRAIAPRWLDRVPYSINRRFDTAALRLRNIIGQVIAAYQDSETTYDDLVSALLSSENPDTGARMSADQVRDEAIAIMFAGTETTATTISWALHEISQYPEAQERLHAEATKAGADPTDLSCMTYTRAVVQEALRLHSPLLFTRKALADVQVGTHAIPAQSEIAYSPYALHRNPTQFSGPTTFQPDRWLTPGTPATGKRRFMPFGAGPHKCIGDVFAMTEAVITLAAITRRWRLTPLPGHTVRQQPAGMPQPNALPMIATRRDVS